MIFSRRWVAGSVGGLAWVLSLAVAAFGSMAVSAQTPSQQNLIERQLNQIQQLQRQQLQRHQDQRWRREGPPTPLPPTPAPPAASSSSPVCFVLRKVVFVGAPHLSESDRRRLAAPYLGHCLTMADITKLIRAVTDLYGDRGYITTRATLPPQNISGGTLTIRVIEGRIEGFWWNGKPADDKSEVIAAFPTRPGDLLNLRDLEQGLDQINHLRSNNARMHLIPGNKLGDSRVAIENHPGPWWHATVGLDNSGQRITGEEQVKESVELDDVLGLDDYFALFHNQDRLNNSSQRSLRNWSLIGSIPYGD